MISAIEVFRIPGTLTDKEFKKMYKEQKIQANRKLLSTLQMNALLAAREQKLKKNLN